MKQGLRMQLYLPQRKSSLWDVNWVTAQWWCRLVALAKRISLRQSLFNFPHSQHAFHTSCILRRAYVTFLSPPVKFPPIAQRLRVTLTHFHYPRSRSVCLSSIKTNNNESLIFRDIIIHLFHRFTTRDLTVPSL